MKEQTWTLFYKLSKEKYGNQNNQGRNLKKKNSQSSKPPKFDMKTMYKKKMYTKHKGEKYPQLTSFLICSNTYLDLRHDDAIT